jgi:hypothetical protein
MQQIVPTFDLEDSIFQLPKSVKSSKISPNKCMQLDHLNKRYALSSAIDAKRYQST